MSASSPPRLRPVFRAFTLIELLVAVAVLAIILVLLAQMVSLTSKTWSAGKANADNFSQARAVLGIVDRDVRSMVLRRDLASFVDANSKPACAFYTRMPAPGHNRKLSLVAYRMDSTSGKPELLRSDLGFSYNSASAPASPRYGVLGTLSDLTGATSQVLVDGAVRFEMQFIRADGTMGSSFEFDYNDPSSASNTRSIVFSLLVLDSSALELARSTGKMPALLSAFAGDPPAGRSYGSYWRSVLNSGAGLSALPEPVRRGLQSFERHVILPIAVTQ